MSSTAIPKPGGPNKRSVSFRSSPSSQSFDPAEFTNQDGDQGDTSSTSAGLSSSPPGPAPSSSLPTSTSLKPALKPSSRKLPPPEQYQHPDPLLRRLRLVDSRGQAINLKSYFRDCKVVALYFSSQWAGMPLKEYQKVRQRCYCSSRRIR